MSAPSAEPSSGSTACSGCGISPITLPRSLQTPATSSTEPFGFSPRSGARPGRSPRAPRASSGVGEPAALAVLDRDRRAVWPCRAARRERRVVPLDDERHVAADEARATRSAAARPAAGPASQRIWKPLQIPSTRPPSSANSPHRAASPARSGRSRRSAGSRRTRSRRAARRRRRRAARSPRARPAPARRRARRAPRARRGRRSSPGRRRRAIRGCAAHAGPGARSRSSRSAGSRAAARTSARPARAPRRRSVASTSRSTTRPTRASSTREAEMVERALDRLALRVEDARLRPDEHGRPHPSTTSGSAR